MGVEKPFAAPHRVGGTAGTHRVELYDHCARGLVAFELWAVVRTGNATSLIPHASLVEVDPASCSVRVIGSAELAPLDEDSAPDTSDGTTTNDSGSTSTTSDATPEDNTRDIPTTNQNVAATATTTYACPAGSTVAGGSGATLTCSQTIAGTTTVAAIATTTYACPAGSTGSPTAVTPTCTRATTTSQTVAAIASTAWACPAGSTVVGGSGASLTCAKALS